MFTIELSKLRQSVNLGCTEEERQRRQDVEIDVKLRVSAPVSEDKLEQTVNYVEIVALLEEMCAQAMLEHSMWIETVSVKVTKHVLSQLEGISVAFEASRGGAHRCG